MTSQTPSAMPNNSTGDRPARTLDERGMNTSILMSKLDERVDKLKQEVSRAESGREAAMDLHVKEREQQEKVRATLNNTSEGFGGC